MVHYQIPASADVYVHRSGRTARAAQDGLAVALVTPREAPRFAALLRVSQDFWGVDCAVHTVILTSLLTHNTGTSGGRECIYILLSCSMLLSFSSHCTLCGQT